MLEKLHPAIHHPMEALPSSFVKTNIEIKCRDALSFRCNVLRIVNIIITIMIDKKENTRSQILFLC